jgi:hypothetical protein
MAVGAVVVLVVIGVTVVANPTGSLPRPAPTSLSATVVPPFSTWVTFTSPEGRFSAAFPGQPDHHSQPRTIAGADVITEAFTWAPGDAAVGFAVGYVDYPAQSLSKLAPETIFANIERAMTDARGWTILASRDVGGSYPGREFTTAQGGEQVVIRAWIVGDREYEAWVTGESPDAEAFLDSFRIVAE